MNRLRFMPFQSLLADSSWNLRFSSFFLLWIHFFHFKMRLLGYLTVFKDHLVARYVRSLAPLTSLTPLTHSAELRLATSAWFSLIMLNCIDSSSNLWSRTWFYHCSLQISLILSYLIFSCNVGVLELFFFKKRFEILFPCAKTHNLVWWW